MPDMSGAGGSRRTSTPPPLMPGHFADHERAYRQAIRHHPIQLLFTVSSLNLSIIFAGICHSNPVSPEVVT
jgi:hypothetical protein